VAILDLLLAALQKGRESVRNHAQRFAIAAEVEGIRVAVAAPVLVEAAWLSYISVQSARKGEPSRLGSG
jgi:hypothetical protein